MTGRRPLVVVGATSLVLAIFFVRFAEIDLWFSGLFWNATDGFFLREAWWVQLPYKIIPPITVGLVAGALLLILINMVRRRPLGPFHNRRLVYFIAVVAIGPGLVVNVVLKDNWGRARPRDVVEFGGDRQFTPAFIVSDQCPRNCSFVAGHPSMAFALFALVLLMARRRQELLLGATVAVTLGLAVGFGRILQGGHFLSDVVFSGIITVAIAAGLYTLFALDQPPDSGSEA
jgi:lipid A 4'-phosphatase